jgi:hypothetical protein
VVNSSDVNGRSALMLASRHDFAAGVRLLLTSSANLTQRDLAGRTALQHACATRASSALATLLATDAIVDMPALTSCAWPLMTGTLTRHVLLGQAALVLLAAPALVGFGRRRRASSEPPLIKGPATAARKWDRARRRKTARPNASTDHSHAPRTRLERWSRLGQAWAAELCQWVALTPAMQVNVLVCSLAAGVMMVISLSAGSQSRKVLGPARPTNGARETRIGSVLPSTSAAELSHEETESVGLVWQMMLYYLGAVVLAAAFLPDADKKVPERGDDRTTGPEEGRAPEEKTGVKRSSALPAAVAGGQAPPPPPGRQSFVTWSRVNTLTYMAMHYFAFLPHGQLQPLQSLHGLAVLRGRTPLRLSSWIRVCISLHHLVWLLLPLLFVVPGLQLTRRLRAAFPPWMVYRTASFCFGSNDLMLWACLSDYLAVVRMSGHDPLPLELSHKLRVLHGHALAHATVHLACAMLFIPACREQLAGWGRRLVRNVDSIFPERVPPAAAATTTHPESESWPTTQLPGPPPEEEPKPPRAECVLCLDAESSHILAPCGHMCVCGPCAFQLAEAKASCPLCRQSIVSVVSQVYRA